MAEVAMYRATRKGQVDGRRVAAGQVFPFEGTPGMWMEPVNGPAETARKKADDERAKVRDTPQRVDVRVTAPPLPNTIPPSGTPELIKSHPDLPNPAGSSGEEKGDTEPYAAVRRQIAEQEQARAELSPKAATGRRGARKGAKRRKASAKAVEAAQQPVRPQSDPLSQADDAGTE
jgi:hypothetical protein